MFSANSPSSVPIQSESLALISTWRASSHAWRAMSSFNSNGHRVVRAVAGREVVGGASCAFERLDLADHDPVHQPAGGIGGVVALGREALAGTTALGGRLLDVDRGATVLHPFGHVRLHEPLVASEVFYRKELTHQAPPSVVVVFPEPMLSGPVMPPASTISASSLA